MLTCQHIPQKFIGDRFTPRNVNLEVVPFVYHNLACVKLVQVFQWFWFFFFVFFFFLTITPNIALFFHGVWVVFTVRYSETHAKMG